MKNIEEWAHSFNLNEKAWLLLGKGPSFDRFTDADASGFFTCSLNHVVRELPVTLAHVADVDVVQACSDAIYKNARTLVMPYYPHLGPTAGDQPLAEYVQKIPVLAELEREGRLVGYNLSSAKCPFDDTPIVPLYCFSASAALGFLAQAGVTGVRSLGIDGGTTYSSRFQDLVDVTLLRHGSTTFDVQWPGFAEVIRRKNIFYAPLHVPAPVRVFVGASEVEALPVQVLEYSIKKHATMSVDVQPVDITGMPVPQDPANRSRTRFSLARYRIPELCGMAGRGIYLDSDMLAFADITQLWTYPMNGAQLLYVDQPAERGRRTQTSVMLMDCAALRWDTTEIVRGMDEGRYNYDQLVWDTCIVDKERAKAELPFAWNSLEHYEPGRTCLLHYTDLPTQPWLAAGNPLAALWYDTLREALDEGFISESFVRDEVARAHVSADLPRWIGLAASDARHTRAGP